MSNVPRTLTDVNPDDEIPFYTGPAYEARTDTPPATPLADLLAASYRPRDWRLVTLARFVTDAKATGDRVEAVMTPRIGRQRAQRAATRAHDQRLNYCLGLIAWAFETL